MTAETPTPTFGAGFKKLALTSLLVIVVAGSAVALPPVDFAEIKSHIRFEPAYVESIEAQTLAEYDRVNARTSPSYEDGRIAAQLFAYYLAGGDFYGEGWLQIADLYARAAWERGCRDPLVLTICDLFAYSRQYSIARQSASNHQENIEILLASGYPALFKFRAAAVGLRNFLRFSEPDAKHREDMSALTAQLPSVFDKAMKQFAELVKSRPPGRVLEVEADSLFDYIEGSEVYVPKAGDAIDSILADANSAGDVRAYCRGTFLVEWAWTARGTGWAKTVTQEGWRLMKERLAEAAKVLDKASEAYPKNTSIPTLMLTVERGQGVGLYRMQRWFKMAVENDPDNYQAYSRKMTYLQPRWHGSPEDVLNFGIECLKTERWEAKIPMVLCKGIHTMADQSESIYANESIWELISKRMKPSWSDTRKA